MLLVVDTVEAVLEVELVLAVDDVELVDDVVLAVDDVVVVVEVVVVTAGASFITRPMLAQSVAPPHVIVAV